MEQQQTPNSPADGQSFLTDALSDPHEAVLNTIDDLRALKCTSYTRSIGFVTVNGKRAQVQICVDTNQLNWVRSDNE